MNHPAMASEQSNRSQKKKFPYDRRKNSNIFKDVIKQHKCSSMSGNIPDGCNSDFQTKDGQERVVDRHQHSGIHHHVLPVDNVRV